MAEQTEIRKLKEVIKMVMKRKGYKYADLAKAMQVSETTVKRILTKDDPSLPKLFFIFDWLGLNLAQVAQLMEKQTQEVFTEYSVEQEEFLVNNPGHQCIFEDLLAGYSPEEVAKKYNLSSKSLHKYLLDLDTHNFIELHPHNRVRLLGKGALKIRADGPLRTKFVDLFAKLFGFIQYQGMKLANRDPKYGYGANSKLRMRPKTFEQLKKEIVEIEEKYTGISFMEVAIENSENLIDVAYCFSAANFDSSEMMFGKPKNFE